MCTCSCLLEIVGELQNELDLSSYSLSSKTSRYSHFGLYYNFIKFWGQTVNFGKNFTVAVTVASGLLDADKRQAGYEAVSTRTKAAYRIWLNGKPVTTKNVHNG